MKPDKAQIDLDAKVSRGLDELHKTRSIKRTIKINRNSEMSEKDEADKLVAQFQQNFLNVFTKQLAVIANDLEGEDQKDVLNFLNMTAAMIGNDIEVDVEPKNDLPIQTVKIVSKLVSIRTLTSEKGSISFVFINDHCVDGLKTEYYETKEKAHEVACEMLYQYLIKECDHALTARSKAHRVNHNLRFRK